MIWPLFVFDHLYLESNRHLELENGSICQHHQDSSPLQRPRRQTRAIGLLQIFLFHFSLINIWFLVYCILVTIELLCHYFLEVLQTPIFRFFCLIFFYLHAALHYDA